MNTSVLEAPLITTTTIFETETVRWAISGMGRSIRRAKLPPYLA
jgi:hypothetical protein